jgi:hypothetical protein
MTRSDGFAAREKEREAAEVALLGRLRERRAALGELLAGSSDHGGYEDPVYRFYHQSFKVYYIQEQTKSIVAALTGLGDRVEQVGLAHAGWSVQQQKAGSVGSP